MSLFVKDRKIMDLFEFKTYLVVHLKGSRDITPLFRYNLSGTPFSYLKDMCRSGWIYRSDFFRTLL